MHCEEREVALQRSQFVSANSWSSKYFKSHRENCVLDTRDCALPDITIAPRN